MHACRSNEFSLLISKVPHFDIDQYLHYIFSHIQYIPNTYHDEYPVHLTLASLHNLVHSRARQNKHFQKEYMKIRMPLLCYSLALKIIRSCTKLWKQLINEIQKQRNY